MNLFPIERWEPSKLELGRYYDAESLLELDRYYPEHPVFECSRCHRKVGVEDGGSPDDVDVEGTWCSNCWCEVANG